MIQDFPYTCPRKILVIRPDRIGDVVCITPALRALRNFCPESTIGVMVRPRMTALLSHHPCVDLIHEDEDTEGKRGLGYFLHLTRELKKASYDAALIMLPTSRHSYMTFLAGIPTRISVGWKFHQFITGCRMVSRQKYIPLRHESEYCLDLVRRLGIPVGRVNTELSLTDEEISRARRMLIDLGWDEREHLISIHPDSGRSAPNWDQADYLQLIRLLVDMPGVRVMVHLPPEKEDSGYLFAGTTDSPVLLPKDNGDLRLLLGLIHHADVVVSSSTGPLHMAAALKRPTVSLFCPLPACSSTLWGPIGNEARIVEPPPEYCQSHCPGDPHVCTLKGGILPGTMVEEIKELLISTKEELSNEKSYIKAL